jgi:hypothetical protein
MIFNKNNNFFYFFFFLIIWFITFAIEYFYNNGIPLFICNDSFQYLEIARNFFINKSPDGLIKYALDLYYDEIAHFKYDFGDLKPYHFPSYSFYLSLFYYIYDNNNFVIYFSQYIAFIIFSFSGFLILNQYTNKKTSFILMILSMFTTSIVFYISDSGKEILLSGLSLLAFYLGIYSKNQQKIYNQIILCIILTFLSITRSFYLLQAFIIAINGIFSFKFIEQNKYISKKINKKIIFSILIFFIPLISYFYCYYYLEYHFFIYDNRSDIYGGRNWQDLLLRLINNIYLAIFGLSLYYIQRIFDSEAPFLLFFTFHLLLPFFINFFGLFIWGKNHLYQILKTRILLLKKIDLIYLFFAILTFFILIRFSANGYRLVIGLMPLIYLYFYQNFIKKNRLKLILLGFLITNLLFLIEGRTIHNFISKYNYNINLYTKDIIDKYNAKFVATDFQLYKLNLLLPLYHLYPDDIYFLNFGRGKNLCDDLQNYHQHNINFDLIINSFDTNIFENFKNDNCTFIIDNFQIVDINSYGIIYLNKSKIIH